MEHEANHRTLLVHTHGVACREVLGLRGLGYGSGGLVHTHRVRVACKGGAGMGAGMGAGGLQGAWGGRGLGCGANGRYNSEEG